MRKAKEREAREDFGGEGGRRGALRFCHCVLYGVLSPCCDNVQQWPNFLAVGSFQVLFDNHDPVISCQVHRSICQHARRATTPVQVSRPGPQLEVRRSARTSATVKLKDLHQGMVKLEEYDEGLDYAPRYPTVVQGHRNNMQKFKNCVVLTRVGGFYEVCLLCCPH